MREKVLWLWSSLCFHSALAGVARLDSDLTACSLNGPQSGIQSIRMDRCGSFLRALNPSFWPGVLFTRNVGGRRYVKSKSLASFLKPSSDIKAHHSSLEKICHCCNAEFPAYNLTSSQCTGTPLWTIDELLLGQRSCGESDLHKADWHIMPLSGSSSSTLVLNWDLICFLFLDTLLPFSNLFTDSCLYLRC